MARQSYPTRPLPPPVAFAVGDTVLLRKPHPCGGSEWEVVRVGADIGIRCLTCAHKVLLPRLQLERRLKKFVNRVNAPEPTVASPGAEPA